MKKRMMRQLNPLLFYRNWRNEKAIRKSFLKETDLVTKEIEIKIRFVNIPKGIYTLYVHDLLRQQMFQKGLRIKIPEAKIIRFLAG